MATLAGPFLVAAVLLGAGGALKLARPATTARALREMGMPVPSAAVRLGAAAELVVAAGAVVYASPPFAVLVAVSYLGFAGFVLAALRRGLPLSSCGCFGVQDTPPTAVHLGLNLTAAGVALAVAFDRMGGGASAGLASVAAPDGLLLRATFAVLTAASAWLAYVALTLLPRVRGARP